MGKASRNKRAGSARERIAAQRAAARRAEVRRRVFLASGAVVVVVAIVVAFVVVKLNHKNNSGSGPATGSTLSASVVSDFSTVPASTLNAVGVGAANPKTITPISGGSPLTSNGKPEVVYIGAEYCPYCAAERWAMVVALSRFGTFTGLHGIHSDANDVYPNTPTLTFYKSAYKSKYIAFTPVETETVNKAPLQKTTAQQDQLISKYDAPPYVSAQSKGSIPFVDFGNKYMISGASYNPQVLAGKTWAQVASALKDPSSDIAKGADGAANMITAAICKLTNNQPASVCTPAVKALEAKL
jgi:thiol-disulfide isomerase/thioredoxin